MCIPNLVKIIHHCNRVDFTEISITFNWIFYRRRHQHNTVTVSAAAASKANMFRIEQGGASWRVPASWTLGHPRSARLFVWFRPSYRVGSGRVPYYRVGSGRVPSYPVGSLSSLTKRRSFVISAIAICFNCNIPTVLIIIMKLLLKSTILTYLGTLAEIRNITVVLPLVALVR